MSNETNKAANVVESFGTFLHQLFECPDVDYIIVVRAKDSGQTHHSIAVHLNDPNDVYTLVDEIISVSQQGRN